MLEPEQRSSAHRLQRRERLPPALNPYRPCWQAARHEEDAWLDQIPGKHRLVFDTTTPDGANWAATFANNYYTANGSGYGLKDADLAVIIVRDHCPAA